jgi:hypothetical protein
MANNKNMIFLEQILKTKKDNRKTILPIIFIFSILAVIILLWGCSSSYEVHTELVDLGTDKVSNGDLNTYMISCKKTQRVFSPCDELQNYQL